MPSTPPVRGVRVGVDNSNHNTDDPNQPYALADVGVGGDGGCARAAHVTVTIAYDDKGGAHRTAFAAAFDAVGTQVTGAYTHVRTTATVHHNNCDSARSASCDATVSTAPK